MVRLKTGLAVTALLLLFALSASAVEMALPGDFMYCEVIDNDPGNEGYYYCAAVVSTPYPTIKPYPFIMNARGEVVWFTTHYYERNLGNFKPTWDEHVMHALGDSNHPRGAVLLDPAYTALDTIPHYNPYRETMTLDAHDYHLAEDGSLWSLWWDPVMVDMTSYGGLEECLVDHHTIQQWDAEGNLLWEWRSIDHEDELPYDARLWQNSILDDYFEHLHINSFQVLPDGDILVSARVMDLVFLIDRDTGSIEWAIGWGPRNEFEFSTELPDVEHLIFNLQHDAQLLPGNRLTVFDNGNRHEPQRSYGREYILDLDNMTAELVWLYNHPDGFYSKVTGSTRIVDNDKRLICWGGGSGELHPTTTATEVTADNELVWELTVWASPDGPESYHPTVYRVYKTDYFNPSAKPFVSSAWFEDEDRFEIQCNWFGHEDVVAGYQLYMGSDPGNLLALGTTIDGYYDLTDADTDSSYYVQMQPLDANLDPVGPMSNLIKLHDYRSDLVMLPENTRIGAEGGAITYDVIVNSATEDTLFDLTFQTSMIRPDGTEVGPLTETTFDLPADQYFALQNQQQSLPDTAPTGDYLLIGQVRNSQDDLLFSQHFTWTKDTTSSVGDGPGTIADARLAAQPGDFVLGEVAPNPFNPSATVTALLRRPGNLRVTVYNSLGRLVATLHDGPAQPGQARLVFDGRALASGVYLLQANLDGEHVQTRKLVLAK